MMILATYAPEKLQAATCKSTAVGSPALSCVQTIVIVLSNQSSRHIDPVKKLEMALLVFQLFGSGVQWLIHIACSAHLTSVHGSPHI